MELQPSQSFDPFKVIKYDELDKGFILRAGSPEIARLLKRVIKYGSQ